MNKKAFTLMEVMIVLTLVSVLSVFLLVVINPWTLINRGFNANRKKDLDDAKKMLEQYINDTGCYPLPTQVCFEGTNTNPCHLCTKKQTTPFPYFTRDICEPREGNLDYLYEVDTSFEKIIGNVVTTCPKWFKIFAIQEGAYNAAEDIWGCYAGGCGVYPLYGYRYLVNSPGAKMDTVATTGWYCHLEDINKCVACTPYSNCTNPNNSCYGKELYPLRQTCCTDHGITRCN